MGRSRQSADRERQDLGHMSLLGSVGGVVWCSPAQGRFVNSLCKRRALVSSTVGSYLRGTQEEGTEKQGRILITRAVGEIISGTYTSL